MFDCSCDSVGLLFVHDVVLLGRDQRENALVVVAADVDVAAGADVAEVVDDTAAAEVVEDKAAAEVVDMVAAGVEVVADCTAAAGVEVVADTAGTVVADCTAAVVADCTAAGVADTAADCGMVGMAAKEGVVGTGEVFVEDDLADFLVGCNYNAREWYYPSYPFPSQTKLGEE